MNIKTDIPQIYVLRKRIEQKIGFTPTMHIHFLKLVSIIEGELREHVSESTLERVWGYSTRGYESVSLRTLNVFVFIKVLAIKVSTFFVKNHTSFI